MLPTIHWNLLLVSLIKCDFHVYQFSISPAISMLYLMMLSQLEARGARQWWGARAFFFTIRNGGFDHGFYHEKLLFYHGFTVKESRFNWEKWRESAGYYDYGGLFFNRLDQISGENGGCQVWKPSWWSPLRILDSTEHNCRLASFGRS